MTSRPGTRLAVATYRCTGVAQLSAGATYYLWPREAGSETSAAATLGQVDANQD